MNNQIDYIEFPAQDLAATKRFYENVFAWTFTDYGPGYTSFADGRLTGGFSTDPEHTPGPLAIIYADNLEAMEQKVKDANGRIVKPIFSFPGGRRFHFTDPAGNQLAVWSDK
jgi:predicted enzyme related to lactoylglutathione lyase